MPEALKRAVSFGNVVCYLNVLLLNERYNFALTYVFVYDNGLEVWNLKGRLVSDFQSDRSRLRSESSAFLCDHMPQIRAHLSWLLLMS